MIFLDTSSAIQILNGNPSLEIVIDKFKVSTFGITTPSIFELYHGIYKLKFLKLKISKEKYAELKKNLDDFINQLIIFALDKIAADNAAKIHVQLKLKGQTIDIFDCLIASIILSNGFKEIITHNIKHFEKIENLIVHTF